MRTRDFHKKIDREKLKEIKKNKRERIHLIGPKIRNLMSSSIYKTSQNGFCNAGCRRMKILVSGYKLGNH
jgi:hypothetical protein